MVARCCVSTCKRYAGVPGSRLTCHRLPRILNSKYGPIAVALSAERRKKWLEILKDDLENVKSLEHVFICGIHFIGGVPAELGEKDNPDWVPTQYLKHPCPNREAVEAKIGKKTELPKYRKDWTKPQSPYHSYLPPKNQRLVNCSVPDCNHCSRYTKCQMYRYSHHYDQRKQWAEQIGLTEVPTYTSFVCICHFEDGDRFKGPTIFGEAAVRENGLKLNSNIRPDLSSMTSVDDDYSDMWWSRFLTFDIGPYVECRKQSISPHNPKKPPIKKPRRTAPISLLKKRRRPTAVAESDDLVTSTSPAPPLKPPTPITHILVMPDYNNDVLKQIKDSQTPLELATEYITDNPFLKNLLNIPPEEPSYDFTKICRICMLELEELRDIFLDSVDSVLISDMLNASSIVDFSEDDDLPRLICPSCIDDLKPAYKFSQKCVASHNTLKSYSDKLKSEKKNLNDSIQYEHSYISIPENDDLNDIYFNSDYEPPPKPVEVVPPQPLIPIMITKEIVTNSNIKINTPTLVDLHTLANQAYLESLQDVENETEKKFKCNDCLEGFEYYSQLVQHPCIKSTFITTHSEVIYETTIGEKVIKFYKCKLCFKIFMNLTKLVSHDCFVQLPITDENVREKRFQCTTCRAIFLYYSQLLDHRENYIHANEKTENKSNKDKDKTKNNVESTAEDVTESPTELLEKSDVENSLLESAIASIEPVTDIPTEKHKKSTIDELLEDATEREKDFKFACSKCDLKFEYFSQLFQHNRNFKHPVPKDAPCPTCGKVVPKQKMYMHTRKHRNDRPYVCEVCGKGFKLNTHLRRHRDIRHLGIKKYECQFCQRKFGVQSALDAHELIHKGQKPFICECCGRGFRQNGALNWHINKGHCPARKPSPKAADESRKNRVLYECGACDKKFRTPGHLKIHLKSHKYVD